MLGPITDLEAENPPYQCGHLLRTWRLPAGTEAPETRYDESLGHDRYVPLNAQGEPFVAAAYLYTLLSVR